MIKSYNTSYSNLFPSVPPIVYGEDYPGKLDSNYVILKNNLDELKKTGYYNDAINGINWLVNNSSRLKLDVVSHIVINDADKNIPIFVFKNSTKELSSVYFVLILNISKNVRKNRDLLCSNKRSYTRLGLQLLLGATVIGIGYKMYNKR